MLITFLEGRVPTEREADLKKAYDEIVKTRYDGIVETFMSRGVMDPSVWRIFSLWKDKEAFEKARQSADTIKGILIFRAVGVEPSMSLFELVDRQ